ncbi:MAG: bifunctional hydroxymethylpyrimidine kinase/phosphomethylpyrimidine kinase [Treponema sp.]|nr:bifunctional hydroxymethylpyrimidine kinase/phosphomethylpyrimidine kinase [Treponema sp.]
METVLTIAGSDSIGGAGIQADIKTITCNGCYAMSAISAMTAQNTLGVKSIMESTPEFLADQIDAVFSDIVPDSVKIGMTSSTALIKVIGEKLKEYSAKNIVLDPVMVSTSGTKLISEEAVSALKTMLFPLATVITPNIPEAEVICGFEIKTKEDMERAGEWIQSKYGCNVLIKGGHSINDANDFLKTSEGSVWFSGKRISNSNTHGTGCTLSSAIASNLAKGKKLEEAVRLAKDYISSCLEANLNLGKGSGPLMHNYKLVEK